MVVKEFYDVFVPVTDKSMDVWIWFCVANTFAEI